MTAHASSKSLTLMIVLLFSFWSNAEAQRVKRVRDGVWGGQHMGLWLENGRGRIEYDCASGTIDEPLRLDRRGRFNVKGTHHKQRGGPIRIDAPSKDQPARYTGSLVGQTLTITVTLTTTRETIGTFRLTHNQEPRIVKCLTPR